MRLIDHWRRAGAALRHHLGVLGAGARIETRQCWSWRYEPFQTLKSLDPPWSLDGRAGLISFFLCAGSVKTGIQGVGRTIFSALVLAAVQGATMAEWSDTKKEARTCYRLPDTWTASNTGDCDGFDWMLPQLADAKRVGITDATAVVAEPEKMSGEPTLFGPRTYTAELHHQNQAR